MSNDYADLLSSMPDISSIVVCGDKEHGTGEEEIAIEWTMWLQPKLHPLIEEAAKVERELLRDGYTHTRQVVNHE